MSITKRIKELFKPKLKLLPGTRLTSFLFIAVSIALAFGILFAANIYYNIDTGEIVLEEIQRVTQVVRATAGLVVGGTATQNPAAGVALEVATTSDVLLSGAGQALRFSGGTSYYTGFRATTTMTTTTVYYLPPQYAAQADYVLTWQEGNQLEWTAASELGLVGDIAQVGNVTSGVAFTGGDYGNTLWFEGSTVDDYEIALTGADPGADYTITLPALTGTLTLASGNLGTGGILFADNNLIATSTNFTWTTSTRTLTIGSSGNSGQLRIYDNSYYVSFTPTSTMVQNTAYYLPPDYGQNLYVLTTDGAGNLTWQPATGTGAVLGSGTQDRLAKWTGTTQLGNSGIADTSTAVQIAINDSTTTIYNTLDPNYVAGFTLVGNIIGNNYDITGLDYVEATTLQVATIRSAAATDLTLNPQGGTAARVLLGTGDWIETGSGYKIGATGTQILREIVPIMGFDLPAQTATTSYVKISRTLDNYPFVSAAAGSTRVHKLFIRYTDNLPAASSTNWRVATTTDASYYDFTLPGSNNTNLDQGQGRIVSVNIPNDGTDWWLEVQSLPTYPNNTIRVFQIFLAAYDEISS